MTRAEENLTIIGRDTHPYMKTVSQGLNQQLETVPLDYFEDIGTPITPVVPNDIAAASTKKQGDLKASLQTIFASPSNLFDYIRGGETRLGRLRAERDKRLNTKSTDNLDLHSSNIQVPKQSFIDAIDQNPNLWWRMASASEDTLRHRSRDDFQTQIALQQGEQFQTTKDVTWESDTITGHHFLPTYKDLGLNETYQGQALFRKGIFASTNFESLGSYFDTSPSLIAPDIFKNRNLTVIQGKATRERDWILDFEGEDVIKPKDVPFSIPSEDFRQSSNITIDSKFAKQLNLHSTGTGQIDAPYVFKFFEPEERQRILSSRRFGIDSQQTPDDFTTREAVDLLKEHYPQAESFIDLTRRVDETENIFYRAQDAAGIAEHHSYDLSLTNSRLEPETLAKFHPDAYSSASGKVFRRGVFATEKYKDVQFYLGGYPSNVSGEMIKEGGNLLHMFRGESYDRTRHLDAGESVVKPLQELYRTDINIIQPSSGFMIDNKWVNTEWKTPLLIDAPAELFAINPRRRFLQEQRPLDLHSTGPGQIDAPHVFKFFEPEQRQMILGSSYTPSDYTTREAVDLLKEFYPAAETMGEMFERGTEAENVFFRAQPEAGLEGHHSYDLTLTMNPFLAKDIPDAYLKGGQYYRRGVFATQRHDKINMYLRGQTTTIGDDVIQEGGHLLHIFAGETLPKSLALEQFEAVVKPSTELYRVHKDLLPDAKKGSYIDRKWHSADLTDAPAELFAVEPRRRFLQEQRPLELHSGQDTRDVASFLNKVDKHPRLFYRYASTYEVDKHYSQDLYQTSLMSDHFYAEELPLPDSFFKEGDAPFGTVIWDERPISEKLWDRPTEAQEGAVYRYGKYGKPTSAGLGTGISSELFKVGVPPLEFGTGRDLQIHFGTPTPHRQYLAETEDVFLSHGVLEVFPTNVPEGTRYWLEPSHGEFIDTGGVDFDVLAGQIKGLPTDTDSARIWGDFLKDPQGKTQGRLQLEDLLNPQLNLQLHSGILQPGNPDYPIGISQAFKSPQPLHYSGDTSLLRQGLPRIAVVGRATDPTVHELAIAGATGNTTRTTGQDNRLRIRKRNRPSSTTRSTPSRRTIHLSFTARTRCRFQNTTGVSAIHRRRPTTRHHTIRAVRSFHRQTRDDTKRLHHRRFRCHYRHRLRPTTPTRQHKVLRHVPDRYHRITTETTTLCYGPVTLSRCTPREPTPYRDGRHTYH